MDNFLEGLLVINQWRFEAITGLWCPSMSRAARALHWRRQRVYNLGRKAWVIFQTSSWWGLILVILDHERGIPSTRKSSACEDYVPALCELQTFVTDFVHSFFSMKLIRVLNSMRADPVANAQIARNARSILEACVEDCTVTVLGQLPCQISTGSLDGRGRAQRAMRVPTFTGQDKTNFRPWHITWIDLNGEAPVDLQYSHRCHNENCCEPSHGLWESDAQNKERWSCRICSHLVLPDGKRFCICPHSPCCFRPLVVEAWNDPRFEHTVWMKLTHVQVMSYKPLCIRG